MADNRPYHEVANMRRIIIGIASCVGLCILARMVGTRDVQTITAVGVVCVAVACLAHVWRESLGGLLHKLWSVVTPLLVREARELLKRFESTKDFKTRGRRIDSRTPSRRAFDPKTDGGSGDMGKTKPMPTDYRR